MTTPQIAIAYIRVSTEEQALRGVSLESQANELRAEGARLGWEVIIKADEGFSAKDTKRPALQEALAMLDAGEAQHLMAIRLDRISRSVADFSQIMARADKKAWSIALLDLRMDTSTPSGKMLANVMASMAEYERELISDRTRRTMATAKLNKHVGRPRALPVETVDQVVAMRNQEPKPTLKAIAEQLNTAGVPASNGALWTASKIQSVLKSRTARGEYIEPGTPKP